ncbi:MAG: HU family DNA-binding protein [Burkholderiales bacterium]|jgi:DNA-binding protein HU-beta|nr:HU family DNA-binding protein [Burkholderiales bacterium]
MTKQELVKELARVAELKIKDADCAITTLVEIIQDEIRAGHEITLPGLGVFSVKLREARTGRNPATGEELEIPAKRVPTFKAAKALKDAAA